LTLASFPRPCAHACVQKSHLNIIISSPVFVAYANTLKLGRLQKPIRHGVGENASLMLLARRSLLDYVLIVRGYAESWRIGHWPIPMATAWQRQ